MLANDIITISPLFSNYQISTIFRASKNSSVKKKTIFLEQAVVVVLCPWSVVYSTGLVEYLCLIWKLKVCQAIKKNKNKNKKTKTNALPESCPSYF